MSSLINLARAELDRRRRVANQKQSAEESLYEFVKMFWHVIEPANEFVEGRVLEGICSYLESVTEYYETNGESGIQDLLINVPPGFSKSILTSVMWPAWEWGPRKHPNLRYACFSYSADLTARDNLRFKAVILSPFYQQFWGDQVTLTKEGEGKLLNTKMGWKLASSVGGVGTGERGDRLIIDDPHNIKDGESEVKRNATLLWWREVIPSRLNNPDVSSKIVIMQRVHEADVSNDIIEKDDNFTIVRMPMEFDPAFPSCDMEWREEAGELLWPERFNFAAVQKLKSLMGPFAASAQLQQSPTVRGGNIINRDWWKLYDMDYAMRLGLLQEGAKKLVYPPFDLVIVSVDTALTSKKENCYSGCTVWGTWKDEKNLTKIMLIYAWQARLTLHGMPAVDGDTIEQRKAKEGLVERIARTASTLEQGGVTPKGAQAILIENKANGADVINEFARLYRNRPWQLIPIDPRGDKVARTHAAVPVFTNGLIYAPDKEWAQKLIDQMASFPRGQDKDMHDSAIQALLYMRNSGIIMRPDEESEVNLERAERELERGREDDQDENFYGA